jgi:hypothetical protein
MRKLIRFVVEFPLIIVGIILILLLSSASHDFQYFKGYMGYKTELLFAAEEEREAIRQEADLYEALHSLYAEGGGEGRERLRKAGPQRVDMIIRFIIENKSYYFKTMPYRNAPLGLRTLDNFAFILGTELKFFSYNEQVVLTKKLLILKENGSLENIQKEAVNHLLKILGEILQCQHSVGKPEC